MPLILDPYGDPVPAAAPAPAGILDPEWFRQQERKGRRFGLRPDGSIVELAPTGRSREDIKGTPYLSDLERVWYLGQQADEADAAGNAAEAQRLRALAAQTPMETVGAVRRAVAAIPSGLGAIDRLRAQEAAPAIAEAARVREIAPEPGVTRRDVLGRIIPEGPQPQPIIGLRPQPVEIREPAPPSLLQRISRAFTESLTQRGGAGLGIGLPTERAPRTEAVFPERSMVGGLQATLPEPVREALRTGYGAVGGGVGTALGTIAAPTRLLLGAAGVETPSTAEFTRAGRRVGEAFTPQTLTELGFSLIPAGPLAGELGVGARLAARAAAAGGRGAARGAARGAPGIAAAVEATGLRLGPRAAVEAGREGRIWTPLFQEMLEDMPDEGLIALRGQTAKQIAAQGIPLSKKELVAKIDEIVEARAAQGVAIPKPPTPTPAGAGPPPSLPAGAARRGGRRGAIEAAEAAPPSAGVTTGAEGAAPPAGFGQAALKAAREEINLRRVGTVGREISAGRRGQVAGIAETIAKTGGQAAEERGRAISRAMTRGGTLRQTFLRPLALSPEQAAGGMDEVAAALAVGTIREFEAAQFLRWSDTEPGIIQRLLSDQPYLRPAEAKLVNKVWGPELSRALDDLAKTRPMTAAQEAREIARLRRGEEAFRGEVELRQAGVPTRAETKAAIAADRARASLLADLDKTHASYEDVMNKARRAVGDELAGRPTVGAAQSRNTLAVISAWLSDNRMLLDSIADTEGVGKLLAGIRATVAGEVADSHLTALLYRRQMLADALMQDGLDGRLAAKVADLLQQAELARRYGDAIPARILHELQTVKGAPYQESLAGLSLFVQRWKNMKFGVDAGVFGVNVLASIRRGGIPMLEGMINRWLAMAHLPHFASLYADENLPRIVRNSLDGLHVGLGPSPVRASEGTLLSYLGPLGKAVDKPVSAALDELNKLQFGGVLQWLRDVSYEGNLINVQLLGQDITRPAVRRAAAESANSITQFARTALRSGRKGVEANVFTSAAYTRSGWANILQMSKVFRPGASQAERIVGAGMILSQAAFMLTVGKFINDRIGISDFIMDPSLPGFGYITTRDPETGKGRKINFMSQASVEKAISQSIRAIAEGKEEDLWRAWAGYFMGRATTPIGQLPFTLAGAGYEAGRGRTFGPLAGERRVGLKSMILNLSPLPLMAQSALEEDSTILGRVLEATGFTTFPESAAKAIEDVRNEGLRLALASGAFPPSVASQIEGLDYFQLGPRERDIVDRWVRENKPEMIKDYEEYRRKFASPFQKAADERAAVEAQNKPEYDKLMRSLLSGQDPKKVMAAYDELRAEERGALAIIYESKEYQEAVKNLPANDIYKLIDLYNGIPDQVASKTGIVDWDVVERVRSQWLAKVAATDKALATRVIYNTERERERHPFVALVENAQKSFRAYYDLPEGKTREQYRREHPDVDFMLWLLGRVTTLRSMEAAERAQRAVTGREIRVVR